MCSFFSTQVYNFGIKNLTRVTWFFIPQGNRITMIDLKSKMVSLSDREGCKNLGGMGERLRRIQVFIGIRRGWLKDLNSKI